MPNNENEEVLLRVEHLCQYFKINKAVDDVSFDIKKGEVFGLVGESGCGKTTTGRSIIKLYNITSGNIYFKGKRIAAGTLSYKNNIEAAQEQYKTNVEVIKKSALSENEKKAELTKKKSELKEYIDKQRAEIKSARADHKRQKFNTEIQMIFQDPMASLNERAKVDYIVSEGLLNFHMYKDEADREAKVQKALREVGLLPEFASRFPHEFSGGQRQRIGIARALIMEPEFVVADEPISALDVSIRAQVLNLLNQLKASRGLTYLFIAHDLSVVRFISDRIAVIYKGRIVELAEAEELFHHPLHPYTKALLSAVPIPDPEIEKKKKLLIYDPTLHDYTISKPQWVEITEGHFVYGNEPELEKYRAEIEAINAAERT